MHHRHVIATVVVGCALLASCSGGSSSTSAGAGGTRTIDVDMRDNAYSLDHMSVRSGETIRFVFHNQSTVAHDAFLGDAQAQMDHEDEMGSMSDLHHGGENAVTVQPREPVTCCRELSKWSGPHGGTGVIAHMRRDR
jgi:uncharacterized cupredoxin-like copper-binding protein